MNRYLVTIHRSYEVDAPTQQDAIFRAFEAEHVGPDIAPAVEVERIHKTEALGVAHD